MKMRRGTTTLEPKFHHKRNHDLKRSVLNSRNFQIPITFNPFEKNPPRCRGRVSQYFNLSTTPSEHHASPAGRDMQVLRKNAPYTPQAKWGGGTTTRAK